MIKIFLVEDEIVVREGIKNNVDWASNGYDFCGEASDGELAFPMIQKLRPDLVITDIKMPFMDGLELSKLIKKELPETEIIFLSGYEEFEYAKEGIKIGVAQYLTKPIGSTELLRVVGEIAEKIEKRKLEEELKQKYIKDEEESMSKDRRKLFESMVSGDTSTSGLFDIAGRLSVDISAMWYNVCLFKLSSINHKPEEYSPSIVKISERLSNETMNGKALLFDLFSEERAIVFKGDSVEEIDSTINEYINKFRNIIAEFPSIKYFFAKGSTVNRVGEIPMSYEKAEYAFAHRFLTEENCIYDSKDLDNVNNEEFNLATVDVKMIERKKVNEFLHTGNSPEAKFFVEEFFKNLGQNALNSNMFRQYIVMDVYFCVCEFVEELGFERGEVDIMDITSSNFINAETTKKYIIDIITKALELRNSSSDNKYYELVNDIKKYIEDNYADEELCLDSIASFINFSPNYISMVFSQETGGTIIKYLTDYRMNKAKELLKCSNLRSSEIGLEVGYRDSHYFSFLFKKTQGVTPTQYRNGN